ncbi:MAG: glycosyl hydrolase family 28-related protein, partial [Candidatus Firestonebacteria bacterium]
MTRSVRRCQTRVAAPLLMNMVFKTTGIINVKESGAAGDGRVNDTAVLQKAIDECSVSGGTVFLPSGVYSTGTLFMKSNVTLHIAKGAVLRGRPDLSIFPHIVSKVPSTLEKAPWRAFIYAYEQKNISIVGEGTISPNGEHKIFQDNIGDSPDRPYGIHFVRCKNITVSSIKILNPAFWAQRYRECEDLTIKGISVFAHANFNNDGLDIDGCNRVIVSDCRIDSSDDALCFKSHGNRPCEEVVVANCILSSHASAIKFGTGSVGGFKKISISNCVVKPSEAKHVVHPL